MNKNYLCSSSCLGVCGCKAGYLFVLQYMFFSQEIHYIMLQKVEILHWFDLNGPGFSSSSIKVNVFLETVSKMKMLYWQHYALQHIGVVSFYIVLYIYSCKLITRQSIYTIRAINISLNIQLLWKLKCHFNECASDALSAFVPSMVIFSRLLAVICISALKNIWEYPFIGCFGIFFYC